MAPGTGTRSHHFWGAGFASSPPGTRAVAGLYFDARNNDRGSLRANLHSGGDRNRLAMSANPKLTDAEWHAIAAHLRTPPTGRPHIDVRGDIAPLASAKL